MIGWRTGSGGPAVARDSDWADDLLAGLAGNLQMLTFFATIAVFLVWFHRVRVNAEVFDPSGHGLRRGWAIGGWFVPPVLLWFPRRIALDCWGASSPREKPRSHSLVNAWWALWLISLVVREVADKAYYEAETASDHRSAALRMLFADTVEIVAAVLAVLFVLALTRMQDDKVRSGPLVPEPVFRFEPVSAQPCGLPDSGSELLHGCGVFPVWGTGGTTSWAEAGSPSRSWTRWTGPRV